MWIIPHPPLKSNPFHFIVRTEYTTVCTHQMSMAVPAAARVFIPALTPRMSAMIHTARQVKVTACYAEKAPQYIVMRSASSQLSIHFLRKSESNTLPRFSGFILRVRSTHAICTTI